jgi:acyl dehydratase
VRAGDTRTTTWSVTGKIDKTKHNGGIVELSAVCENQNGVRVAEARSKVLIGAGDGAPAS